jgi:RNA polymerase sigma factor (TIGR02999 family)
MEQGNDRSAELFGLVYDELRLLASELMSKERPDHTLCATALVHEAYMRLNGDAANSWKSRAYFFSSAAEAMRRILVDHARRKNALRNGGDHHRVELDEAALQIGSAEADAINVLAIDEAITKLATEYPAKAELVKLLYFAGLSLDEAAVVLDTPRTSVHRQWVFARAWLRLNMSFDTKS